MYYIFIVFLFILDTIKSMKLERYMDIRMGNWASRDINAKPRWQDKWAVEEILTVRIPKNEVSKAEMRDQMNKLFVLNKTGISLRYRRT